MEQKKCCSIENCDIFDFMADHVGLSVLHPGGLRATRRLAELCRINSQTKVIDIACGKGTTSVYLARTYGCFITGVDISKDLIDQASKLAERKRVDDLATFRVADAKDLPFPDEKFDIAVSQAMLILIDDEKKAIHEALRVIRPGGKAGWVELSWKEQPSRKFMGKVSDEICASCMTKVQTFEGWKALFSGAGVKDLKVDSYPMAFKGMRGMIADEGFWNSARIMMKCLFQARVRRRMRALSNFFSAYPEYFGYGIYVGKK